MKELSIEEKARRYDEKLDVARHICSDPSVKEEDKYYIEVIFPELAESKDEKIRKEIIATIHLYYGEPLEDEAKEMIAWLEKQGEQKPADKIEPKFKEGDTIRLKDGDGRLWKIEKIREDGYTMIGHGLDETDFLFLDDKWEVVEPYQESNPTAPAPVRDNYDEIKQAETSPTLSNSSNIRKNAWSEEDINKIDTIIGYIASSAGEKLGVLMPCIDWLKSLKDRIQPQNTWKPSDEQIKVLSDLIAYKERWESSHSLNILRELLDDLKKL